MFKAILYDMDGTVLDTMILYDVAWKQADRDFGCGGRAAAILPSIAGMTPTQVASRLRAELGEDFPAETFRARLFEVYVETVQTRGVSCKKGAPEIFEVMRKMGIRQAICSSSFEEHVKPYLKMAGIENAFDAIITGDMVKNSKPAPDIFLMGAEAVGCAPEECLVVEDAASGIRAGAAAGMRTVMIPEYPPIPEDIIPLVWRECKDLSELEALVRE